MSNDKKKTFVTKKSAKKQSTKRSKKADKTPKHKSKYREDNRRSSSQPPKKRIRRKHVVEEKPKMPLNKFLAHAGLGTRRETVELIKKGYIKVNDQVETQASYQVQDNDQITYKDEIVTNTKDRIYILINKAAGVASAVHTSDRTKNLSHYIQDSTHRNMLPVGKLKKNSTGLIILTSDGDLANQLNDKKAKVENVYRVHTDKPLSPEDRDALLLGVKLLGESVKLDEIHALDEEDPTQLGIKTQFEGDERIYKMLKELGYKVLKLDRVIYAGLTKKNLPRGTSRLLNAKEIVKLKHFNKYNL